MKKLFISIALMAISLSCQAGFTESKISELVTTLQGDIMIALASPASGTCSNQGRVIKLSPSTDGSTNMYSMLLAAKMSDLPVRIWYDDSTAPDTNFPSCNMNTMAVASTLAIQ